MDSSIPSPQPESRPGPVPEVAAAVQVGMGVCCFSQKGRRAGAAADGSDTCATRAQAWTEYHSRDPSNLQCSTSLKSVVLSVVCLQEYNNGVWGAGMRLRRLRAGMQQQYSCAKQNPELFRTGSFGWGSNSLNSSSMTAAAAAAELYARRSSSSGGGSGSSSFTLKQEAAAAFAAAAAADALRPCHVLPELLDVDFLNSAEFTAYSKEGVVPAQGSGVFPALNNSSSSSMYQQQGGELDEADEFTWQEFLATVAAINYPNVYRQQQQQLSREASLSRDGGGPKGLTSFTAKASASLGPIAEGLEGVDAAALDQHAAPASPKQQHKDASERVSPDASRASFSCDHLGGQLTARSLGAAAPAADTATSQQQQRVFSAARARSPAVQQLALADIDKELTTLGLQPIGADPETPTNMFGSPSSSKSAAKAASAAASSIKGLGSSARGKAAAPAAPPVNASAATTAGGDGMWAGPNADTQEYARTHPAAESPSGAAPAAAIAAVAAAETHMPTPPEGRPAKDPSRRVTLFTESMRERGECPAPPRSPRFERATDSQAKRNQHTLSGAKLDEILDSAAGATAGVRNWPCSEKCWP